MRHVRLLPRRTLPKAVGFTLVELMVALALGMMIIVTVGFAYLGGARVVNQTNALSRMQEGARFVFESMTRDIRMAGFSGCSQQNSSNVLNASSSWSVNLFSQPVNGFEEGVSTFPSGVAGNVLRGDAITILHADNTQEYIIDSHNPTAAQFQLNADHDIKQGEILVACDSNLAVVFQMTNVNNNNTVDVIVHNTGNATAPGNYTKGFGIPSGATSPFLPWASCQLDNTKSWCGDVNGTSYTFNAGARIFRLSGATYYIRTNAAGEPALYREKLSQSGGNSATVPEELVPGVENMQILYGEDTNGDKAVDQYVTADDVADWSGVRSVRISLLMVTRQDERVVTEAQTYVYNGATVTASDRLLRRVFTTTIAIRNRL
jgi:type IV pilus assembly protein PilW